jgi:hypothetical protein
MSSVIFAQSQDKIKTFGAAINSSVNGEFYLFQIVPSLVYSRGKSQMELGVGFNPSDRQNQKLLSSEFNYKYYPNGKNNKFNLYFIANASLVKRTLNSYYPTVYNYFFVSGGYGFEIRPFKNTFMGTNIGIGTFTFKKNSEIPYAAFESQKFFDEFGYMLAFQFNLGYKF